MLNNVQTTDHPLGTQIPPPPPGTLITPRYTNNPPGTVITPGTLIPSPVH